VIIRLLAKMLLKNSCSNMVCSKCLLWKTDMDTCRKLSLHSGYVYDKGLNYYKEMDNGKRV
jgi:hypothetical protein